MLRNDDWVTNTFSSESAVIRIGEGGHSSIDAYKALKGKTWNDFPGSITVLDDYHGIIPIEEEQESAPKRGGK